MQVKGVKWPDNWKIVYSIWQSSVFCVVSNERAKSHREWTVDDPVVL